MVIIDIILFPYHHTELCVACLILMKMMGGSFNAMTCIVLWGTLVSIVHAVCPMGSDAVLMAC